MPKAKRSDRPAPMSPPPANPPLAASESPAPPAETPPPPTETDGQVVEPVSVEQAMIAMGFAEASPPEPQPKEEKPTEGQPEAKEEPPAKSTPEPKDEKKEEKPPEPEKKDKPEPKDEPEPEEEEPVIDLDAIHRTVRDAVTSAKPQESAPEKPKPETPALSPSRRNQLEVADYMEKNMTGYQGSNLQDQFKRYWHTEDDYKSKWLKENPGKRFNTDDDAHSEFYNSNPLPDYDPVEFSDAQVLKTEAREQERERKHQEELARIKFEAQSKQVEEEIRATSGRATADLYLNASPKVKEALTVDGKIVFNEQTLDKLATEEPILADRLRYHGELVGIMVRELLRLTKFPEMVAMDPNYAVSLSSGERFHPHHHLIAFADHLETTLLARPASETKLDGKTLLSQEEYTRRSQQIQAANVPVPEKRRQLKVLDEKHYFLDSDKIQHHLIRAAADKARFEAEEYEARLAKSHKFGKKPDTSPTPGPAAGASSGDAGKTTDNRSVRPPSPTISSSDKTNASGADLKNAADRDAQIDRVMWS